MIARPNKRPRKADGKKTLINAEPDSEERELEALVFGKKQHLHEETQQVDDLDNDIQPNNGNGAQYYIDTAGNSTDDVQITSAVWVDEDLDDGTMVDIQSTNRLRKLKTQFEETSISITDYEERLRVQFERINPTPQWAVEKGAGKLSIMQTTGQIVNSSAQLNPEKLDIIRLKDANQMEYSKAVVQCVRFHPLSPVLITAGFDKTARLFHVDGKLNVKIQAIGVKDLPIFRSLFSNDGKELVLLGRRNFFYVQNLDDGTITRISGIRGRSEKSMENSFISPCNKYIVVCGREGTIILISMVTKQWVGNLKMGGDIVTIAFTSDGKSLFGLAKDSEVYRFDLATRKCTHRFMDHGSVDPTTLAISPNNKWVAIGSKSGVVNFYDMKTIEHSRDPKPIKEIKNLVSSISTLCFHPSSQILVIASKFVKDSMRLFHVDSLKVFKNWPTESTPLGYVSDIDISRDGKLVAIANDKGKVLLYRFGAF